MTFARRLVLVASLTAAGAAGALRWLDDAIAKACGCIGRGPGTWTEVDDLLLGEP